MKKVSKTEFHTIHGRTVVYTRRHINGCKLRDRNANGCACPKWIYSKAKGGKAMQRAAGTPSFTEACEEAQRILKGFDPEIAKARQINEPAPGISIEECLALYESSLRLPARALNPIYVKNCLSPLKRRKPTQYKRAKNVSLLDFLDRVNRDARVPITRMEQITSEVLDQWSQEWRTNDLSSQNFRACTNMFMAYSKSHDYIAKRPEFREKLRVRSGNRCGAFSDDQIAKLHAALPFYRNPHGELPPNYAARMAALIDLGRHGGCAVVDIEAFSPRLHLRGDVLSYARVKTGVHATVVLDPIVAARLRSIPPEPGSDPDRPFRFTGRRRATVLAMWRRRFWNLCQFAGVVEVETENGKLPAHLHALRDSCAIDLIVHGVGILNVARALGHTNTAMAERRYLPWITRRENHCIADQRAALARRAQTSEVVVPEPVATTIN